MNWTTVQDLKQQVLRLWLRGDLLRALATGEPWEPRRLALKAPDTRQLSEHFEDVRRWVAELGAVGGLRIQWRDTNHRVIGLQRLPASVWLDSADDAIALIGKQAELQALRGVLELTLQRQPSLVGWLGDRPLQAIALTPHWPALLDVVEWMRQHPQPGIYLRQVDIPGIHTKFIEGHKAVLSELFDRALPAQAIAGQHKGASQFCARYGFLEKTAALRFRVLDPALALLPGPDMPDITLDAVSFSRLDIAVTRVFVTENETNFLAFPSVPEAIVIFGKGYGWETLGRAEWLSRCTIYYWGDIDTHGFAILDQLRRKFGHVESLLMDHQTLDAHKALWGQESRQVVHDLPCLTPEERRLFDELRDNRPGVGVRLEQEHVGFGRLENALSLISRLSSTRCC